MKKLISVLLSAFLVAGIFGACGTSNKPHAPQNSTVSPSDNGAAPDASAPASDELYTVKVFTGNSGAADPDSHTVQWIKENFNIMIDWEISMNPTDQLNIYLASGDYPEIIDTNESAIQTAYKGAGVLLAASDYAQSAPNWWSQIQKYLPFHEDPDDGKVYGIVNGYDQVPYVDVAYSTRYDLLREVADSKTIKTTSDWVDALKAMQEKFPEVNGKKAYAFGFMLGEDWGAQWLDKNMVAMMGQTMYNNCNLKVVGQERLEIVDFMVATQEYYDYMKWFNQLYHEGLVDPESAVMSYDDLAQKMVDGRIYTNHMQWEDSHIVAVQTDMGNPDVRMARLPLLWDGYSGGTFNCNKWASGGARIYMTDKCKYPERIMELADYLSTTEGSTLVMWGVEGVDWALNNGKMEFTDAAMNLLKGDPRARSIIGITNDSNMNYFGARNGFTATGQYMQYELEPSFIDQLYEDIDRQYLAEMGFETYDSPFFDMYIGAENTALGSAFTLPPNSEEATIYTKADQLAMRVTSQLLLAETDAAFDSIYNDAIKELQDMGYERFMNIYRDNLSSIQDRMGVK